MASVRDASHGGFPPPVDDRGGRAAMDAGADASRDDVSAGAPRAGTLVSLGIEPTLAAHIAGCASCRETYDVTVWMLQLAADTPAAVGGAEHELPDPSRIWWKARLLQRWEAEARATAPLDIMQRVEVVGSVIAAVVLLITLWPQLRGADAASSAGNWWPALINVLAPTGLTTLIVTGVVLLALMAVFTVHQLLVED